MILQRKWFFFWTNETQKLHSLLNYINEDTPTMGPSRILSQDPHDETAQQK